MARINQIIDRQLLTRMLLEPARQMQIESMASDRSARSKNLGGSCLIRLVDGQLLVLRKWIETLDLICRRVWQTQGERVTPEFVREFLITECMSAIEVRRGVTISHVERKAAHTHIDLQAVRRHLALEIIRLKAEVTNRYEIEARELEYRTEAMLREEKKIMDAERSHVTLPKLIDTVKTSNDILVDLPGPERPQEVEKSMKYPDDFPIESRSKVEAARIRAGRKFESDKAKVKWKSAFDALFRSYVLTVFLVFAKEACRLRLWPVDKMREKCQEYLRVLTIEAFYKKGKAAGLREMISNWDGSILWEYQQEVEKTAHWRKFESILLRIAEEAPVEKHASNRAALAHLPFDIKPDDRREVVRAYIEEVRSKKSKRITHKDIWSKAGYTSRTEFERWLRQDPKRLNNAANDVFTRILRDKPHLK